MTQCPYQAHLRPSFMPLHSFFVNLPHAFHELLNVAITSDWNHLTVFNKDVCCHTAVRVSRELHVTFVLQGANCSRYRNDSRHRIEIGDLYFSVRLFLAKPHEVGDCYAHFGSLLFRKSTAEGYRLNVYASN